MEAKDTHQKSNATRYTHASRQNLSRSAAIPSTITVFLATHTSTIVTTTLTLTLQPDVNTAGHTGRGKRFGERRKGGGLAKRCLKLNSSMTHMVRLSIRTLLESSKRFLTRRRLLPEKLKFNLNLLEFSFMYVNDIVSLRIHNFIFN
ncbi:hypothetical protein L2E82_24605 [Cichorium intybus]|uniref:Uncharacterized protein n=1 Tax=Cichorium intybus TaxID=13427 RepID=A0ACB9E1H9_CICIN|nr:hypothetical protein L2E82_24605 [Cichorium intybus]